MEIRVHCVQTEVMPNSKSFILIRPAVLECHFLQSYYYLIDTSAVNFTTRSIPCEIQTIQNLSYNLNFHYGNLCIRVSTYGTIEIVTPASDSFFYELRHYISFYLYLYLYQATSERSARMSTRAQSASIIINNIIPVPGGTRLVFIYLDRCKN